MANENLTPPGGWNPFLVSSITKLTGSRLMALGARLAEQPSDERPKLRWQLGTETTDVELIFTEPDRLTLWINPDIRRGETEALALRGLALKHNLTYVNSGEDDENL